MLLVLFVRSEIPLVATIDHIMLTEIKEGILKKIPIGGNSPKIRIRILLTPLSNGDNIGTSQIEI
jgi:hypothetical protein